MKIRFILGWIVDNTTSVINFQWNAQNSDFGHVRTYSSLHKLRNTQGKIHGTYLGNIYGIYKECITNISIDIYDITINIHQYIHQTHRPNGAAAPLGRRRRRRLCVWWIYWWICMAWSSPGLPISLVFLVLSSLSFVFFSLVFLVLSSLFFVLIMIS